MRPTPSRRKLIAVLLLCTGVVGAVMRWSSSAPSLTHELGTMLMVMWVPAVGNIIGYLMRRWRAARAVPPPAFDAGSPFVAHARVELTLDKPPAAAGEHRLVLLVGREAFSARCLPAEGASMAAAMPATVDLQFLAPEAALRRLAEGTAFHVLEGNAVVGRGSVLAAHTG